MGPQKLRFPVRVRIGYIWTLAEWISVSMTCHLVFVNVRLKLESETSLGFARVQFMLVVRGDGCAKKQVETRLLQEDTRNRKVRLNPGFRFLWPLF